MKRPRFEILVPVLLLSAAVAATGSAATCNVPSAAHPDIQSAVADGACTEIVVAAGAFTESPVIGRSLTLRGAGSPSTFIQGRVEVTSGTVHLEGLHLAAEDDALRVHGGAQTTTFDLVAVAGQGEPMLFGDGFETGDLSRWSSATP